MKTKMTFDTRELVRAMTDVEKETGKAWPDILNKTAKDVAFRAWQFTPKAAWSKMQKWVVAPMAQRLVLSRIKKGMDSTYAPGSKLSKLELKQHVALRIRRMKGTIGYIGIGWVKAIEDFGGQVKKKLPKVSRVGLAYRGYGKKATVNKLIAILVNTSTGAEEISGPALQKAVNFKAKDLRDYLQKRLEKTFRDHSAKK